MGAAKQLTESSTLASSEFSDDPQWKLVFLDRSVVHLCVCVCVCVCFERRECEIAPRVHCTGAACAHTRTSEKLLNLSNCAATIS
jgi:hypothetical protein